MPTHCKLPHRDPLASRLKTKEQLFGKLGPGPGAERDVSPGQEGGLPRETQHRQGKHRTRGEGRDPHRWEARPPLQKNLNCKYLPNGSIQLVSSVRQ